MAERRFHIDVRDSQLRRVGELDTYTSVETIIRHVAVGAWSIKLPARSPQAGLLERGRGVLIWLDGVPQPILSGPLTSIHEEWSDTDGDLGQLTFSGMCDNHALASRLAVPDPNQSPNTTKGRYVNEYWTAAQKASDIIKALVRDNVGEAALKDRRIPYLDTGQWLGLGERTKVQYRFDVLLNAIAALCSNAGLTCRIVQPEPARPRLELQTGRIRDLSRAVRLSPGMGNLASYSYEMTAPTSTRAIVAAQGEGKKRFFWQWSNPGPEAEWSMASEEFIDRRDIPIPAKYTDGDDNFKQLHDAAEDALAQAGPQAQLSITPLDTDGCRFGRDYQLGDLVTVITARGATLVQPVREVHLSDTGDATTVQATVGTADATETPGLYTQVRKLWQAVHHLNTRR